MVPLRSLVRGQRSPKFAAHAGDRGVPGCRKIALLFLHAHHGNYAWSSARGYVMAIAKEHERRGRPDFRGKATGAYLTALKREFGTRKGRATDALNRTQVVASSERADSLHPPRAEAVRLRGVVAAAEALGVGPPVSGRDAPDAIRNLPREAFDVRPDAIWITAGSERRALDAKRQPIFYEALTAALRAAGDAARPLAPRPEEVTPRKNARPDATIADDSVRLRKAWGRAHHPDTQKSSVTLTVGQVSSEIAHSSAEDRLWWLAMIDTNLAIRRRDVAYVLVGVVAARRHAEMERLVMGDVEATATGFRLDFGEDKGSSIAVSRGGRATRVIRSVDHLTDDPRGCPPVCPACRLSDHLEVRNRAGAGPEAPVFLSARGTALGIQGATDVVRRVWELVADLDAGEDDAERVIGTRTLRVTGATLARESGMSYLEIAVEVTGHRTPNAARIYVRRSYPFSVDLTLRLDDRLPPSQRGTQAR